MSTALLERPVETIEEPAIPCCMTSEEQIAYFRMIGRVEVMEHFLSACTKIATTTMITRSCTPGCKGHQVCQPCKNVTNYYGQLV